MQAEGFAVVEDPSSGSIAVRRLRKARAAAPVEEVEPVAVDLPDLDADEPSTAQIVRGTEPDVVEEGGGAVGGAIDEQSDVRIDYVDGKGESSRHTITPIRWDGPFLLAWCHVREADRQFRVERIKSVSPVRP